MFLIYSLGIDVRFSTIFMVGGAFVCAAIATLLTASLFKGERPKPAPISVAVVAPAPEVRNIVVAARPLAFGTPLTHDALKEIPWPSEFNLPGTFPSVTVLASEKRTALAAIGENEPVLQSRVSVPGQPATLSALIREGMTAVTIRVDDVLGVAGLVQPGDHVNVLLTQSRGNASTSRADAYSDTLLQGVRVLAVDQTVDRSRPIKPVRAVTVEVSLEQAQKLMLAMNVGQLSLALRSVTAQGQAGTRRIGISDLSRNTETHEIVIDSTPSVTVTRGTDRVMHDVIVDGATAPQRVANTRPMSAQPPVVTRPGAESAGKKNSEEAEREIVSPQ